MRTVAIAAATFAAAWLIAAPPAMGAPLDGADVRWSALDYGATRLFMSATARVEARMHRAADIAPRLLAPPAGVAIAPGAEVLEIGYTASGLGRDSVTTLWVDPRTGASLQRTVLDRGTRERLRTYRFTDIGGYHYTRWPADDAESALAPEQWTRTEEGLRPYPPAARGQPVTEATALLWIMGAAPLDAPGDDIEAFVFSRRHVNRVTIAVTGRRNVQTAFEERSAGATRRREGAANALILRLRAVAVDPAADEDDGFELLGLRGDVEVALDPTTRAPLELRGRVKMLGPLTIRLTRVTLR